MQGINRLTVLFHSNRSKLRSMPAWQDGHQRMNCNDYLYAGTRCEEKHATRSMFISLVPVIFQFCGAVVAMLICELATFVTLLQDAIGQIRFRSTRGSDNSCDYTRGSRLPKVLPPSVLVVQKNDYVKEKQKHRYLFRSTFNSYCLFRGDQ